MKRYNIYNNSRAPIERAGFLFLGEQGKEIDLTREQYKIISKCEMLSVMEVESNYIVKKKKGKKNDKN